MQNSNLIVYSLFVQKKLAASCQNEQAIGLIESVVLLSGPLLLYLASLFDLQYVTQNHQWVCLVWRKSFSRKISRWGSVMLLFGYPTLPYKRKKGNSVDMVNTTSQGTRWESRLTNVNCKDG